MIADVSPLTTAFLIAVTFPVTADTMFVKMLTKRSRMDDNMLVTELNAMDSSILIVSTSAVRRFVTTDTAPDTICFADSQAAPQSPVSIAAISPTIPCTIVRKPFRTPPALSHKTLNQDRILEPQAFQNISIQPNIVSIIVIQALNIPLSLEYMLSHICDRMVMALCHADSNLLFAPSEELPVSDSISPNMVEANCDRNVHTPFKKVRITFQTRSKFCLMDSECRSMNPNTV